MRVITFSRASSHGVGLNSFFYFKIELICVLFHIFTAKQ
nr:MAG TPA: protein of unknown function DUF2152 [Caudoviricetes sp.]